MAQPIAYVDRLRIIKMRQSGYSFAKIAQELGYSTDGVRKIWKRFESDGLKTSYQNSGVRSPYAQIKEFVKTKKTGEQGTPYIRSMTFPMSAPFSVGGKLNAVKKGRQAGQERLSHWTQTAHDTWQ